MKKTTEARANQREKNSLIDKLRNENKEMERSIKLANKERGEQIETMNIKLADIVRRWELATNENIHLKKRIFQLRRTVVETLNADGGV
jgi:plasmid rolling circle replication initiator protein Rep